MPAQPPLRGQLVRFVLTGGLSALVDFGLLVVGMSLGLTHAVAKALSFVAGTTTAYLINRRWTFRADGSKRAFAAVVALYATTFVLQVGLFALLYPPLERSFASRSGGAFSRGAGGGHVGQLRRAAHPDLQAALTRPDTRHGRARDQMAVIRCGSTRMPEVPGSIDWATR
jgi:hypothetical protein